MCFVSLLQELASQIVQTVLNDPNVLDQASQFLQRVRLYKQSPVCILTARLLY